MRSTFRFALAVMAPVWPGLLAGQASQPRVSVAAGAGFHVGALGGVETNGFAGTAVAWVRPAPFAALRADATYAFNTGGSVVCVWSDPCPVSGLRHLSAFGASAMLGNLNAASNRSYVIAGIERLFASGRPEWDGRKRTVPKLGAGVLFPNALFVELTGRWHNEWQGWPLRHFVLIVGRYR